MLTIRPLLLRPCCAFHFDTLSQIRFAMPLRALALHSNQTVFKRIVLQTPHLRCFTSAHDSSMSSSVKSATASIFNTDEGTGDHRRAVRDDDVQFNQDTTFDTGSSTGHCHGSSENTKNPRNPQASSCDDSAQKRSAANTSQQRPSYFRPPQLSHYDVLGVSSTSTLQHIRKAYLAKAKALHPDMNPDDPHAVEKFIDLQHAYNVLSDAAQRHAYDEIRKRVKRKTPIVYPVRTQPEYWTRAWEKETEEERAARRERYRRFAEGDFADVVEGGCYNKGVPDWFIMTGIVSICFITVAVWHRWIDAGKQSTIKYDDVYVASDTRTVRYTAAYLNPFTFEWNSLGEDQEAPTSAELAEFYTRQLGPLALNPDAYPVEHLTVTQLPRTKTTPPVLYRDKKTNRLVTLFQETRD